jgi:Tol biopolymer transport system component/uncharacterized protein YjdB
MGQGAGFGMKAAFLTVLVAAVMTPAASGQTIAEVQVTPDELRLETGQDTRLFAAAYDPQGRIIATASITYLSSDTAIATVTPDGSVTGHAAGRALIEAVAGGRRDTAQVSVTSSISAPAVLPAPSVPVSAILLEPASVALIPLEPARLIAHVSTADSSTPPVVPLSWTSGDSRVAAVDRDGVVVGTGPGITTITATAANGVIGTATVAVDTALFTTLESVTLASGATDTLFATIPTQGDRHLTTGLNWSSENPAVATAEAGGIVRAVAPGETVVTVRGYGMVGRIKVRVRPPVAGAITVPNAGDGPVSIPVTTTRRFDIRALDAAGNVVDGVPIAFTVADTTVASFADESRTLTARKLGTTTLTAQLDGVAPVVWTITVAPISVAIERKRLALRVGDRVQLAARLLDPGGAPVPGVSGPITWTSTRPSVASVSNGAISAAGLGHTMVRASTPYGSADSVEVYVNGDLLISSDRAARGGVGIYAVRLAEPGMFVPVLADTGTNLGAAYSPDRTRIAFSSNRSGTFDIWLMDADGTRLTQLTSGSGNETEPAWSPDGTRIVYTSSVDGQTQIASIGVDGSAPTQLTETTGGNVSPAVSPDGRIIAFASGRAGNYEIYEMAIDGSGVRRITATPQRELSPRFFSNGDLLYASDRPKGGSQIIRQSGSSHTVLAETNDAVLALALSGDGRRYVYLAGQQVERGGRQTEYRVISQLIDGSAPAIQIPLGPGEQAATPDF